jgi:hypothetical protein
VESLQEDIEHRSVSLAIRTSKLTALALKNAISKYLAYRKNKRLGIGQAPDIVPKGKQTVKQLIGQNQGVSNIEVTEKNIKSFDRVARKYGVDYAVKKDRSVSPPKYLVFFKARDADALTAAFKEFTAKTLRKKERTSVRTKLTQFREMIKRPVADKTRHKEPQR